MSLSNTDDSFIPEPVRALVGRIPLFEEASDLEIAPLQGVVSLNNTNYRIRAQGTAYLLRFASDHARFLGVRRDEEIEAARAAAQAGVGPPILYAEPIGHLLTPWIEGRHWPAEEYHNEASLLRLAETLRRLHGVTDVRAEGSVFRRIERLLESARSLDLETPPHLDACLEILGRIEQTRREEGRWKPGLSHNDLWSNNFLDDGENLWLLDWEFAGCGDGLYDLATVSMAGSLSEAEETFLLRACGEPDPDGLQPLHAMKWVASFFEGAWALVMHGLRGSTDFNYLRYCHSRFDYLTAQDSSFDR